MKLKVVLVEKDIPYLMYLPVRQKISLSILACKKDLGAKLRNVIINLVLMPITIKLLMQKTAELP